MSSSTKPTKSCRLGAPNARPNGTARTTGQPMRLGEDVDTTCALSALSNARVDAARLWVLDAHSKPISKKEFLARAVDSLTREVLAANPGFKLPPSCEFVSTE